MLTPTQLKEHRFTRLPDGNFDSDEVNIFFGEFITSYTQMYKENAELIRKITVLANKVEQYREDENNIRDALLSAQRTADSVLRQANEEVEELLAESQEKARQIIENAHRETEDIVTGRDGIITKAENSADRIIENAQAEANLIIAEAQNRADKIEYDASNGADAVKQSISKEASGILEEVNKEAQQLLGDARAEAERILSQAKLQAEEINAEARKQADELSRTAKEESERILDDVQSKLELIFSSGNEAGNDVKENIEEAAEINDEIPQSEDAPDEFTPFGDDEIADEPIIPDTTQIEKEAEAAEETEIAASAAAADEADDEQEENAPKNYFGELKNADGKSEFDDIIVPDVEYTDIDLMNEEDGIQASGDTVAIAEIADTVGPAIADSEDDIIRADNAGTVPFRIKIDDEGFESFDDLPEDDIAVNESISGKVLQIVNEKEEAESYRSPFAPLKGSDDENEFFSIDFSVFEDNDAEKLKKSKTSAEEKPAAGESRNENDDFDDDNFSFRSLFGSKKKK